jgi:multiple antibiotic resistance protein
VAELIKFFGLSLSVLLPLVNPLGDALVFLGHVGTAPHDVYRALARKIAISTTLFLLTIELVGTVMLKFSGISLPAIQVSGGLVLVAMGWNLLSQNEPKAKEAQPKLDAPALGSLERKIFYPFTFPMTTGPGSIVVIVTLSAYASIRGGLPDIAALLGIALAVVCLSVAVYFCYRHAPTIAAHVSSAHGILRLMTCVSLCIVVQITWNGVEAALKTALQPK